MPITFEIPEPNQPFGFGFRMRFQSDFIGPLPEGSFWTVTIFSPVESEVPRFSMIYRTNNPAFDGIHGDLDTDAFIPHAVSDLVDGQPARLEVKLTQAPSTVIDQTSQPIIIDWQTGMPKLLDLARRYATQTGGFTQADREVQAEIRKASFVPFVNALGQASDLALSSFTWQPPSQFLRRSAPFLISGSGVLTRPAGQTIVRAYGIQWNWEVLPPGFGRVYGRVDEYANRMVQFVVIRRDQANELYVDRIYDENTEGHFLQWGNQFPTEVQYYIAPGVTLRCFWLDYALTPQPVGTPVTDWEV